MSPKNFSRRALAVGALLLASTAPDAAQTILPDVDVEAPAQVAAASKTTMADQNAALDAARVKIFAPLGANVAQFSAQTIAAAPQGDAAPINQILLQAPGVSQDSAASGLLHVRNEHANVQYRVNGVLLPDGVSGFGLLLDTPFVGQMALLTGALPAQYGQHTSAVVDVLSRDDAFDGGAIGIYGGSRGTLQSSVSYGGSSGATRYFFTGSFSRSDMGIENTTPSVTAIHDRNALNRFFGSISTILDDGSRLTFIAGSSAGNYQIPATPGQTPFPGVASLLPGSNFYPSSAVQENQYEASLYNVLAWQKNFGVFDAQISAFSRASTLQFSPDPYGDLLYNGVASNVLRNSFVNGVSADLAWRVDPAHTLRTGVSVSGEQAYARNASTVFATDDNGDPFGAPFAAPVDSSAKFGWLIGLYVQDEWLLSEKWTLNAGLRFDQMVQYVDANQFSPRFSLTYAPFESTKLHAGFARNFTPPSLALSAPANLALFANTTAAPAVNQTGAVLPERSSVVDVGLDQQVTPDLSLGVDAYLKWARDLLDDGQFGQAMVLTAFNYDRGVNQGVEFKANFSRGDFSAYANLALAKQMATNIVSNQYLFDADELAFIATHYIYTDHAQTLTASAGASYNFNGLRSSLDMIAGSGLRAGFANTQTVAPYAQFNLGFSREFAWSPEQKPLTLRFDVVNIFDTIYQIRDGSGIGVFAPQYGPRRGFFFGLTQKI